jgi:hypothetical protein
MILIVGTGQCKDRESVDRRLEETRDAENVDVEENYGRHPDKWTSSNAIDVGINQSH